MEGLPDDRFGERARLGGVATEDDDARVVVLHGEAAVVLRLSHLVDVLETLLTALRERERRREQLRAQLAALDAAQHVASLDLGRMRKNLTGVLADWRALLLGDVVVARQAVRKLVPEPLVFTPITTPEGERLFEFQGEGRLGPDPRRPRERTPEESLT